jgi:hypothetical protein
MAVERAESYLIEVDESKLRNSGACQQSRAVRAYTAASDNHDERIAEFLETFRSEKYPVACKLLKDELFIEITRLRPPR